MWYDSNTLHSVYALSDASESVVERYKFDAYGAATVLEPDGASDPDGLSDVENPYLFTARRADLESGLMQYRYREYDRTAGRFISRDPLRYFEGPNLYVLARGNPVSFLDPFGLRSVAIEICLEEGEWEDFSADDVQQKLNEYMAVCSALLQHDDFSVVVRDCHGDEYDTGWSYDRELVASHLPWWGWVNPVSWLMVPPEAVYSSYVRRPTNYAHKVIQGEGVKRMLGAYAYTNDYVTQIGARRFHEIASLHGARGYWAIAWSNLLAHEVFHIGLRNMKDDDSAPRGDIRSRHMYGDKPVKIDEDWCCGLIKDLELK